MVERRLSLSDDLPMAEWQRLRVRQLDGDQPGSFGLAQAALSDEMPIADWQRARALQAPGAGVVSGSEGNDLLVGGAGADRLGAGRRGAGPILGLISEGEGTNRPDGYDMTFNNLDGKHYPAGWKKPTQLTIDQAIAMKPDATRMAGDYAVGKYQFRANTLAELKRRMGLKGTELMTPDLQDEMAEALIYGRGYADFLAGRKTPAEFQQALAREWRSLAAGPDDYAYRSDGKAKARKSTAEIQAALAQARTAEGVLDDQLDGGYAPPP
ncbi:MAG TPA: hypothetical protein VFH92_09340 [Phenylobacterium sp.]|nr:hypothetical protein [Phenylobacterium sp.]